MNISVAAVCAAVLVVTLLSEQCFSLKTSKEEGGRVQNIESTQLARENLVLFHSKWHKLNTGKYTGNKANGAFKRVVRQTYQGQTQIYPTLPTGAPYGLAPFPNQNNQNIQPGYNNPTGPYGQNPQPNSWQSTGQSTYNNPYGTQPGYPNYGGYKPGNFSSNPSGTNGQYPQPNSWQPNGQQNYNNPYGTNTQFNNNNTQSGYPAYNGYKPSNFSHNPSGPYGQSTPPTSWQSPYSSNNGQRPYSGNSSSTPYPGYKPSNTYNNPSGRPPYQQPGQTNYPTTPSPYSSYTTQRSPYYPGQSQTNNFGPGNQHPVIYDNSTNRPGQSPYNGYNAPNWSGNTLNHTQGNSPYNNPQNGKTPQYFNSYSGSPGYGQQNSSNPYNINQGTPYQGPHYGQNSSIGYPNSGYNPSIPNRSPYGSPYGNGPYASSPNQVQYPNGTSQDPTRVSPQYFNGN